MGQDGAEKEDARTSKAASECEEEPLVGEDVPSALKQQSTVDSDREEQGKWTDTIQPDLFSPIGAPVLFADLCKNFRPGSEDHEKWTVGIFFGGEMMPRFSRRHRSGTSIETRVDLACRIASPH